MIDRLSKLATVTAVFFLFVKSASLALASETIIQQENMPFDRCLKVITTSENKLSIAPVIKNISNDKRVAVFTLSDGTLSITCDGNKGLVTVSTAKN